MKCPKCKCEAQEIQIEIFESKYGLCNTDFDIFGIKTLVTAAYRGIKKVHLAIEEKKLYQCTNPKCLNEFEA